jgi:hypothetical protein
MVSRLEKSDWLAILKLSKKWGFSVIFDSAKSQLTNADIDPVEKVTIAREYNVYEWLVSGLAELVSRKAPLSLQETEKLGVPSAISIFHLREHVSKEDTSSPSFSALVEETFAKEIITLKKARIDFMVGSAQHMVFAENEVARHTKTSRYSNVHECTELTGAQVLRPHKRPRLTEQDLDP